MTLRASGPEYAPLRTFRDDDLLDAGSDPLIAIIGALSGLNDGERVVARLLLRSMGPEWSQVHQQKALRQNQSAPGQSVHNTQATQAQISTKDGVTLAVLGVAALVGLRGYLWYQDGELLKASLLGAGTVLGLVAAGWGWWRWKHARSRVYDPLLIREKTSRTAFDGEIQVTAILPEDASPDRVGELLAPLAAAYKHYDNPAGARFRVSKIRPLVPSAHLHPAGPGLFGKRSILGVREAAGLWHPPGAGDETPLVARAGSRALLPSAKGTSGGALVGETTTGPARKIHFPHDLLRRHHLYVARTRMGKSTLMEHVIAHKLKEKAAGNDHDAIIVVDPHADLVGSLLAQVPESLIDSVKLIDLADRRGFPGINLLDTRIFADRDRTADSVVRVAHGLWEQWGPRMQSILEHAVKSLHEANEKREPENQYTILDGLRILSDDDFRDEALAQVDDHHLLRWWAREFGAWRRDYQGMALAPVQTRLAYYASSKTVRAILGQPRFTIDLRETILEGGILLVSTAQGAVGRDVAALVGSSILNLVDGVIREQGSLPPEQRRGALVVVDEMQTMPGVDYESMLSELGKFGANFILATQSLAKLGGPVPHHARHRAGQRGLPGRLPDGGDRRPPAGVGTGQGTGQRGRRHLPGRAPVLRAGHRGRRAHGRLLHEGAPARAGRPGRGPAHPGTGPGLPHAAGGHRPPGRGDAEAGGEVPGGAGAAPAGSGPPQGEPGQPAGPAQAHQPAQPEKQAAGAARARTRCGRGAGR